MAFDTHHGAPHRIRFRPTPNGHLHLGGAFVARACARLAKQKCGEFVVICDDVAHEQKVGPLSLDQCDEAYGYAKAFVEDLTWLGYKPDRTVIASAFRSAHVAAAKLLGIAEPGGHEIPGLLRYVHHLSESGSTCSYHPWLTLGRVVDDHELGVTGFIRGADLLAEAQLYDHFARELYGEGYRVLQEYMPILLSPSTLGVCSKSAGGDAIREYRDAGLRPEDLCAAMDAVVVHQDRHYGSGFTPYVRLSPEWERVIGWHPDAIL